MASEISIRAVWAYKRRNSNRTAISEEFGHFGDAADVFFAVFGTEAQIFVEAEADIVAVEAVGGEVVGVAKKGLLEGYGDGGFAGGRKAGEPDCEALLAAEGGADGRSDVRGVEGYVAVIELVSE